MTAMWAWLLVLLCAVLVGVPLGYWLGVRIERENARDEREHNEHLYATRLLDAELEGWKNGFARGMQL